MAAKQSGLDSFLFFSSSSSSSSDDKTQLGLGFLDSSEKSLPPPPPSLEVLPSEISYTVDPVNFSGRTFLKGRVSTQEVFHLSNSDLVPGKYEGGLKLWEGSLDLVKTLQSEIQDGQLLLTGKRVLELGCGHGLPGIFTGVEGAAVIHFHDFNAEVLRCLTILNVNANLLKKSQPLATDVSEWNTDAEFRFFAGDWSEVHQILPCVHTNEKDHNCSPGLGQSVGYDVILMAETAYSISALPNLYELIKKCLNHLNGVVYMAAKKHYFGVGGGSRQFLSVVDKDGVMEASLVSEVADGSSNVREAAGSFNHHGMQYSTALPNDPDIHKDFIPTNKLESSGLSLKDIVEQDVKDNLVMLYMKGVPDLPRCGFSSLAVRVLKEYNVPLSARNILEDPELKNAVKAYSNWPTFPQIFIKGEFIGGSDIILKMHQTGKLKEMLKDIAVN